MNPSKAVNCVVTKAADTGKVGDGKPAIATACTAVAAIVAFTVTIWARALAVIFNPIFDGGAIASDGVNVVCIRVILVVAKARFVITTDTTPAYPAKAAVAVIDIGIDVVTSPLAIIAGGSNILGILFPKLVELAGVEPASSLFSQKSHSQLSLVSISSN